MHRVKKLLDATLIRGLVGLLLAAPAAAVALAQGDAAGTEAAALFGSNEWLVTGLTLPQGQFEILPGSVAYLRLGDGMALAGTAGCNQLSLAFTLGPNRNIEFGPAIATRMACPEPVMAQESAILGSFEHLTHYRIDAGRLVLSGAGHELVLTSRAPAGSAAPVTHGPEAAPRPPADGLDHGAAVQRYAAAFNDAVAAAAAAGADWPGDPLRVALAFLELVGAPDTVVTRADVGAEHPVQTVVTVVEKGLLDDSVDGLEQAVTLELRGGVWTVSSYRGAWLCRRPAGTKMALPGVCL